ncbi:MAG: dienelactone hydrolase family protein [Alphaproteobacteria bacterium]|nr:dienelactone hydrolase family protein [Alphaproteobacteria bacterium]
MTSRWIEIPAEAGSFKAYVSEPAGTPKGTVVVIQEIFGVNEGVRGKADWLAREGFLAIAPDLFWRLEPGIQLTDKTEGEWAKAFDYMKRFDGVKGLADITSTIDHARSKEGATKVGAVGYCLGGYLAYMTACHTSADASVGYYGVSIETKLDDAKALKKPLMLHIAGKDQFVPKDAQDAINACLKDNPLVTLHTYAEQDHAFTRVGGAHYDAHAAELADARTVAFFKQHLS